MMKTPSTPPSRKERHLANPDEFPKRTRRGFFSLTLRNPVIRFGLGLLVLAVTGWMTFVGIRTKVEVQPSEITSVRGQMYVVFIHPPIPFLKGRGDTSFSPSRSQLELNEDGQVLWPAHTIHDEIGNVGKGAYSHWHQVLYFSSSDGTDPRQNGRVYTYTQPLFFPWWMSVVLSCTGLIVVNFAAKHIAFKASSRETTKGTAIQYGTFYALIFFSSMLVLGYATAPRIDAASGATKRLPERVKAYLNQPENYNVLFLGDSRTFCGIHPEIIESHLPEMKGLNLSTFSNWFPTQIGVVRDLVEEIPKSTVVVWSIGHINFYLFGRDAIISRVYRVPLRDATSIVLREKQVQPGLLDNIAYYQSTLYGAVAIPELRAAMREYGATPAFGMISETNGEDSEAEIQTDVLALASTLEATALGNEDVVHAEAIIESGQINSVVRYYLRGGYHRTELNSAYFRAKQIRAPSSQVDLPTVALKPLPPVGATEWFLFLEILDLFEKNGVRLVINELEEAPYVYGNQALREQWRDFMRTAIQPEVERRGFGYIRVDLDQLTDEDYFDYNHMNSSGVEKFSPMLAESLRSYLGGKSAF